jgi:hypothetical protein
MYTKVLELKAFAWELEHDKIILRTYFGDGTILQEQPMLVRKLQMKDAQCSSLFFGVAILNCKSQ